MGQRQFSWSLLTLSAILMVAAVATIFLHPDVPDYLLPVLGGLAVALAFAVAAAPRTWKHERDESKPRL